MKASVLQYKHRSWNQYEPRKLACHKHSKEKTKSSEQICKTGSRPRIVPLLRCVNSTHLRAGETIRDQKAAQGHISVRTVGVHMIVCNMSFHYRGELLAISISRKREIETRLAWHREARHHPPINDSSFFFIVRDSQAPWHLVPSQSLWAIV